MITKAIGIISWLPNDNTRVVRQGRLEELLSLLEDLFKLPIIIIAQDWDDTVKTTKNCEVFHYAQLGIVGARKELRLRFLASDYEYLIMLDDDALIKATKEGVVHYLKQIDNNPGKVGVFKQHLLKLFAISKEAFALVDYDDVHPEQGEGFEDMIFIEKCHAQLADKIFIFNRFQLDDISNSGNDPNSTWYKGQFKKKEMGDKSREIIKTFKC